MAAPPNTAEAAAPAPPEAAAPVSSPEAPMPTEEAPTQPSVPAPEFVPSAPLSPPPPAAPPAADVAQAAAEAEQLQFVQSEATRADLWIQAMEKRDRERRIGGRWMSVIGSGVMAGLATASFFIEGPETTAARAALGATFVPAAAGIALGLFLPEEQAAPWAFTGFALAGAALATSFAFDWARDSEFQSSRDERLTSAFFGATLASQFLWLIPIAFLERGVGKAAYTNYYATPAQARPHAASELLIEADRNTRAKAGVLLIGGLLTLGAVSVGAGLTEDPMLLFAGLPTLMSTLTGVVPLLFRPTRLEMFLQGEMPTPGVFRF